METVELIDLEPGDLVVYQTERMSAECQDTVARVGQFTAELSTGRIITGSDWFRRIRRAKPEQRETETKTKGTDEMQSEKRKPKRPQTRKQGAGLMPPPYTYLPGCRMPMTDGVAIRQCGAAVDDDTRAIYCQKHRETTAPARRARQAMRHALKAGKTFKQMVEILMRHEVTRFGDAAEHTEATPAGVLLPETRDVLAGRPQRAASETGPETKAEPGTDAAARRDFLTPDVGVPYTAGRPTLASTRMHAIMAVRRDLNELERCINMTSAAASVDEERRRQDDKWGVQNHSPEWWLAILMEEVGELSQTILETHFDNGPEAAHLRGIDKIRNEAVQAAAVAMAMIECIDRNSKQQGK